MLTASLAFMLAAATAAPAPLTIEDYVLSPSFGAVELSPDGKRIAYVLNRADLDRGAFDSDIWLIDTDGRNHFQLTRGPRSDSAPEWSPDGKKIAFLSDRDGSSALYLIDPAGGEAMKLTDAKTSIRGYEWSPDSSSIAFIRIDDRSPAEEKRAAAKDDAWVVGEDRRHAHLHVLDVKSGATRRLTQGEFTVWSLSWSPDGRTIAFDRGPGSSLDDMYRTDLYRVPAAGGEMTPLVVRDGLERYPTWSPDGKSIAFTSTRGTHDWLREHFLHVLTLADGSIRTVAAEYERTPESIQWSPDSKTLWFEGPLDSTTQLFRVDAGGGGFTNVTGSSGMIGNPSVSFTSGQVAFVYQTLNEPAELHVSGLTPFRPRRLTDHNAPLRDRLMGETRLIRWKNPKDGLEIEGFLTLPPGHTPGRKLPLLTIVHGGPASRFDQGFLGYLSFIYPTQVFASRGYAVLRPNPRGTGGYGETFRQANRNDWGGMDWVDISAGIDSLIEQGIADPDRLGLMGWSYGGFLASWALSQSDRFKAISIGAPVTDLLSYHGTADIRSFIPEYFKGASLDELRARSPMWHLRRTSTPVLIQHGEDDERVPLSQGTMLYRRLDELGANVTMVIYPRTPHTPREPKLRLDASRRNVDFFTRHIPVQ